MTQGKPKIVVVGAGVAGSLIASGLRDRADCEVICLERAGAEDQAEAGTGLNIGPNAMTCLDLHLPRESCNLVIPDVQRQGYAFRNRCISQMGYPRTRKAATRGTGHTSGHRSIGAAPAGDGSVSAFDAGVSASRSPRISST